MITDDGNPPSMRLRVLRLAGGPRSTCTSHFAIRTYIRPATPVCVSDRLAPNCSSRLVGGSRGSHAASSLKITTAPLSLQGPCLLSLFPSFRRCPVAQSPRSSSRVHQFYCFPPPAAQTPQACDCQSLRHRSTSKCPCEVHRCELDSRTKFTAH